MGAKTRLLVMSAWGSDKVFGDLYDTVFQHGFTGWSKRVNLFSLALGPEDTIVLEGGTDINPNFYDQRPCRWTQRPDTQRDAMENAMIKKGMEAGANFLGICRGAQFLTAVAGGELIQHVSGHTHGAHPIKLLDGRKILTNSFHHQMMFPFGLPEKEYKILAHVENALSNDYIIEGNKDISEVLPKEFVEIEMIWYPEIKALGIQGHPEFVATQSYSRLSMDNPLADFVVHSRNLVKEYILNDIPV